MRRLLMVVLVAVFALFFGSSPTSATTESLDSVSAHTYDNLHLVVASTRTMTEPGPPASYDRVTDYGAVDRSLGGACARPGGATPAAAFAYDRPALLVRAVRITGTTEGQPGIPDRDLLSLQRSVNAANGGGDAVRFVTGADGVTTDLLAPSGKLPFPKHLVPEGMTPNAYGNTIWGVGPQGAKDLIGTRSASELESLGLTVRGAEQWQDFYLNVYTLSPRNAAAGARVDLMQDIINTLRGPR